MTLGKQAMKNRSRGCQRKANELDYLKVRLRELFRENQKRHEFVNCMPCQQPISTQSEEGEIRWVQ